MGRLDGRIGAGERDTRSAISARVVEYARVVFYRAGGRRNRMKRSCQRHTGLRLSSPPHDLTGADPFALNRIKPRLGMGGKRIATAASEPR